MDTKEQFFNQLAEKLEELFPKYEKCDCGRRLPCRSKALSFNAWANILFDRLTKKERDEGYKLSSENAKLYLCSIDFKKLDKLISQNKQKRIKEMTTKNKFMFAVVSRDEAGETIQLFKTRKQAEEFYRKLKDEKTIIQEIPQMKGTLEALNKLTILKK